MPNPPLLPTDEREQIDDLTISFDNAGRGLGLGIQAR